MFRSFKMLIAIALCCAVATPTTVIAAAKPEPLFPFIQRGKLGYVNKSGHIAIPAKFDTYTYEPFAPEDRLLPQAIGKFEDAQWGFIDRTGRFVIEPQYEYVGEFENGIAKVGTKSGERWIDETGKVVIAGHDVMGGFGSEGFAIAADLVGYDEAYNPIHTFNFINKDNAYLSDISFAGALGFSEGLAAVNIGGKSNIWGQPTGGKWGYLDAKGRMAIEAKFDYAFSFVNGFAGFNVGGKPSTQGAVGAIGIPAGGKWGYIDRTGAVVIKPQYQDIGSFSDGVAPAKLKDRWGIIDTSGKFVAKPIYRQIDPMDGGMFRVANDADYESYGIITQTGRIVGNGFSELGDRFAGGLLHVYRKSDNTGAYIDTKGKFVLKRKGVRYGDFRDGIATYSYTSDKKHLRGLMDRNGKYLTKPIFLHVDEFRYGLAHVTIPDAKGNLYDAYVDTKGKTVWKSKVPQ
ncbi:WG repeat-containing protein [Cohnella sp. GCM10027633]|uniref:WG repeat-containing protein n=1 Tax=unclassified Cohnella TaxID=2636738 RepID=UPI003632F3E6